MIIIVEVVTGLWLFAVGACVGSFLNVVAYRWPRRMTLLGASQCPYCKRQIPFYDNVPVLGWLHLRGRCRHCCLPISVRYPLIEFATGTMVLLLGVMELRFGATNVPFADHRRWGFAWTLFDPDWQLLGLFAAHLLLSLFLLTSALIEAQAGQRLPRALLWCTALAGIGLILAWPSNLPQLVSMNEASLTPASHRGQAVLAAAIGALMGTLLGCVATLLVSWMQRTQSCIQAVAVWAVVGIFVGWQGVSSVFLIFLALWLVIRLIPHNMAVLLARRPLTLLLLAGMIHLLLWSALLRVPFWPAAMPNFSSPDAIGDVH